MGEKPKNRKMTLRVLSLFSGIGAFEKALTNLKVDYEVVNFCEIDGYAAKSYCAIHDVDPALNLVDVTKIDTSKLKDIDLITYGFPCQDISTAGRQKGFVDADGNITRSGLFFEALRIIKDLKPKFAIAENVKALTSKKFEKEFNAVKESLNAVGYNNYYKVLNATEFGIPQNRERVFIVSIRKDVDDYSFEFPSGGVLTHCLYDFLEKEVDETFYKKDERTLALIKKLEDEGFEPIFSTKVEQVGNFIHTGNFENPQRGRVYSSHGISPSLNCVRGGGLEVKVIGNLYDHSQANEVLDPSGVSKTLCALDGIKSAQVKIVEAKIKSVGTYSSYNRGQVLDGGGISQCLAARDYKDPIRVVVGV